MLLSPPKNNKYSPEYFNEVSNHSLEQYKGMIKAMTEQKDEYILDFVRFLKEVGMNDEKLSETLEQAKQKIIEINKENDEKQIELLTELMEMCGDYLRKTYVPQEIRIWKRNPETGLMYEEYEYK